jgi:hypothetical protein
MKRALLAETRGGISVMAILLLVSLVGFSALVVEYGHGILSKSENQRAADLAAFSGAVIYQTTTSSNATTAMQSAVGMVAKLNGLSGDATGTVVTSPSGDGNSAIKVVVTTTQQLALAGVVNSGNTSLSPTAASYAEIVPANEPGCFVALGSATNDITMTGSDTITADNCAVNSNSGISLASSSTEITTQYVNYQGTAPNKSFIKAPTGKTTTYTTGPITDPICGATVDTSTTCKDVTTAVSRLGFNTSGSSSAYCAGTAGTVCNITPPIVIVSCISTGTGAATPTAALMPDCMPTTQTAMSFGYGSAPTLPSGCTASFSSNTWTVTCTASSTPYKLGALTLAGGITLNFAVGGSASNVYIFTGNLDTSGGSGASFGPGTYEVQGNVISANNGSTYYGVTTASPLALGTVNFYVLGYMSLGATTQLGAGTFAVQGGLITDGGSKVTFGAGTFDFGTLPNSTCSTNGESICNTGTTLTFGGPSTFVMGENSGAKSGGGIYVSGGGTMTMGSGTSNSFDVGADANGNSFIITGGDNVTLADATGSGDLFQLAGNLDNSGGGSCLYVSAATNHDINGNINLVGGVDFGAGMYTVTGYVGIGVSSGGNVTCNGVSEGVQASGVTFVIGASDTISSCNGVSTATSFCVSAGYNSVNIVAPTSSTAAGLEGFAVIGPPVNNTSTVEGAQSPNPTAGASFGAGASGTKISGAFYFPDGPVTMSGAATVGDTSAGDCLEMIAQTITMSGGTATGSSCVLAGSSSGTGTSGQPQYTLVE